MPDIDPCVKSSFCTLHRLTRHTPFSRHGGLHTAEAMPHLRLEGGCWRRVREEAAGKLDGRVVARRQAPGRAAARVEALGPVLVEAVPAAARDVDLQPVVQRHRCGCTHSRLWSALLQAGAPIRCECSICLSMMRPSTLTKPDS